MHQHHSKLMPRLYTMIRETGGWMPLSSLIHCCLGRELWAHYHQRMIIRTFQIEDTFRMDSHPYTFQILIYGGRQSFIYHGLVREHSGNLWKDCGRQLLAAKKREEHWRKLLLAH